eukprot:7833631-Pyramimonas_sp.AAC.1
MIHELMHAAWNRRTNRLAADKLGIDRSDQLDSSGIRSLLASAELSARHRNLLRAFSCQSIWTKHRLWCLGYDTDSSCLCGNVRDDIHHRLFTCPLTQHVRDELLSTEDLDILTQPDVVSHQLLGFQVCPSFQTVPPEGIGHEEYEWWAADGSPPEVALRGVVFSDGSAYKDGHRFFHRAGWGLVKLSDSGE